MAEGNGEIPIEEVPGKDSDVGRTPDYRKLIDYGLDPKVSNIIYCQYTRTFLSHLYFNLELCITYCMQKSK